jgi:hypothetical protein
MPQGMKDLNLEGRFLSKEKDQDSGRKMRTQGGKIRTGQVERSDLGEISVFRKNGTVPRSKDHFS